LGVSIEWTVDLDMYRGISASWVVEIHGMCGGVKMWLVVAFILGYSLMADIDIQYFILP
jgi:hypothetical protein